MSPRRPDPRFPTLPVALVVASGLLLDAAGGTAGAPPERRLPGSIPRSPPQVTGFPIPFHRPVDFRERRGGVLAADLDADGRVELVVSVPSGVVTLLGPDGTVAPGWPRTFQDLPQPAYPVGPPALGDLDGDGLIDVVACVVSGGTPRRNFVHALDAGGADLAGWPVEVIAPGQPFPSCPASGPATADLDGDGRDEVALSVGPGHLTVLDDDGGTLSGWPMQLGPDEQGISRAINARLGAADLDGDGRPELLFVESGLQPRLGAVSAAGHFMEGFPLRLDEVVDRQAPVATDLDGDGRPEIVLSTLPFSPSLDASAGPAAEPTGDGALVPAALYVLRADASASEGWPRALEAGGSWGPVLTDLDGDGRAEILQQDGDLLLAFDLSGEPARGFPHMIHRDFQRSQSLEMSQWTVADLNGDARPDLLQTRSNVYLGSAYLRLFGTRMTGQPLKGFPFERSGFLAASEPAVVDLSGDGVADLVMLTSEGTNGRWSLMAWDLGSLLPAGP
ncbi:MAG: FG-GAP repeat domain-containing protein [Acidobacteriota bacterium]